MARVILKLPGVKARTGLSRSTIYLRIADGTFPDSISLGARAVGWLESDIEEWIDNRIRQSRRGSSATCDLAPARESRNSPRGGER